ncbi:MAG: hypothetical protein SO019_02960 [Lachnospiraceae bacterium]|nr:hypothetical protein [Lachnospiraceae bacterium]
MTRMENGEVQTVIVKSIYDIIRCKDDIQTFLQWAGEKDVDDSVNLKYRQRTLGVI